MCTSLRTFQIPLPLLVDLLHAPSQTAESFHVPPCWMVPSAACLVAAPFPIHLPHAPSRIVHIHSVYEASPRRTVQSVTCPLVSALIFSNPIPCLPRIGLSYLPCTPLPFRVPPSSCPFADCPKSAIEASTCWTVQSAVYPLASSCLFLLCPFVPSINQADTRRTILSATHLHLVHPPHEPSRILQSTTEAARVGLSYQPRTHRRGTRAAQAQAQVQVQVHSRNHTFKVHGKVHGQARTVT